MLVVGSQVCKKMVKIQFLLQLLLLVIHYSSCQVTFSGLSVTIEVDYTPPPDFVGGPNDYRPASTVTLTCQVEGATGTEKYLWSSTCIAPRSNCFVPGNTSQIIYRKTLRSTDSGNHTCTATRGGLTGTATIEMNIVGAGIFVNQGDGSVPTGALPNNGIVITRSVSSGVRLSLQCRSGSTDRGVGDIIGLDGNPLLGAGVTTGSLSIRRLKTATVAVRNHVAHEPALTAVDEGVYTCRIPDESGNEVDVNIGVYRNGFNTPPTVSSLTYTLTTRTLTCISTGSPATTVTWTRNGLTLTVDGTTYRMTQTVTDRRTSTYENALALVTRDISGNYSCQVGNAQGDSDPMTVEIPSAPTVTLEPTSPTTVKITWMYQPRVASHEVLFERATTLPEQQGICLSKHTGGISVNEEVTEYTLTGLEEYSTYTINVTAVSKNGLPSLPSTQPVTTSQAAPSSPPQSLNTSVTVSTITITWDSVPCMDRNSLITHYSVKYGKVSMRETVDVSGFGTTGGSCTITGLTQFTNYSIGVAAVSDKGIGPFTADILVETRKVIAGLEKELYSTNEEDGSVDVCVLILSESSTPLHPVRVTLSTVDGSATSPDDYWGTTVKLRLSNTNNGTCTSIPITDDKVPEMPQSFTVVLSTDDPSVILSPENATVTILDDEVAHGCTTEVFVLAENQEHRQEEVVDSIHSVFPSITIDTDTSSTNTSLDSLYVSMTDKFGVVESNTIYNQFVEAITEITEAYSEACYGPAELRPHHDDVPTLSHQFATLDPSEAEELRRIFGKMLCLNDQQPEEKKRKKRQMGTCDRVECPAGGYDDVVEVCQFFSCIDKEIGRPLQAVFGFTVYMAPCLAFAVDTTGSMWEEVANVQELIKSFISSEENETACYILTPFNDYGNSPVRGRDYGPVQVFETWLVGDLTKLYYATKALTASGGGYCPEYGMHAIDATLKARYPSDDTPAMSRGSQIIVLTDASAKDDIPSFVDKITANANALGVCIHFFLSGSGCPADDGPEAFGSYERIGVETGGIVVRSPTNFDQVFKEFAEFSSSYQDSPCKKPDTERSKKKRSSPSTCHSFRVSVFTGTLKFLITTAQPHATVLKPNSENIRINITEGFRSYKEVNPLSGEWSVCVDTGTVELTFNNFINFDLVVTYVKEGATSQDGIITTVQTPLACTPSQVVVFSSQTPDISSTASLYLNYIQENGDVARSVPLVECGGALVGDATFPLGSFTYQLQGEDKEGNPFVYNSRKRAEFNSGIYSLTAVTTGDEIRPGEFVTLTYKLQNNNPSDSRSVNFSFAATTPHGFRTVIYPPHSSLAAGEDTEIAATVTATSSQYTPGSTHNIIVTATDGCITVSASQSLTIAAPPTAEPDLCDGCENGGTCITTKRRGRVVHSCRCRPGYGGRQCEIAFAR